MTQPDDTVPSPAAASSRLVLHATAVAWLGRGLLLRGASGAGKSSLALRLLARGAALVADDLVVLRRRGAHLMAEPVREPGLIEARGQGIFRLAYAACAPVGLLAELDADPDAERLPEPRPETILGFTLPVLRLRATAVDAVERLLLALLAVRVR